MPLLNVIGPSVATPYLNLKNIECDTAPCAGTLILFNKQMSRRTGRHDDRSNAAGGDTDSNDVMAMVPGNVGNINH